MSTETDNIAVVRRFNDAFDRGDWTTMRACLSPGVAAYATGAPGKMNLDAFVGMGQQFLDAFSQSQHTFGDQIAQGEVVATRASWSAIHTGAFNGIPPTNRPVKIDIMVFDHVRDGRIVEHYGALDVMSLMAQIGAVAVAA